MCISDCIKSLFEEYRRQPLALMREIGIQARLHQLIQSSLHNETCRIQVAIGNSRNPNIVPTLYQTGRVQMEARIINQEQNSLETSDIVVLRPTPDATPPITTTRYAKGAFDIVSKIHIEDIVAAIEIKASCSADFEQRHRFRKDINKLLQIQNNQQEYIPGQELHFVLIDKSVAISPNNPINETFGTQPIAKALPRHDWHIEDDQFLEHQTQRNRDNFWNNSPRVSLLDKKPKSRPFVHVWEINHQKGIATPDQPLHRYAVLTTQL